MFGCAEVGPWFDRAFVFCKQLMEGVLFCLYLIRLFSISSGFGLGTPDAKSTQLDGACYPPKFSA